MNNGFLPRVQLPKNLSRHVCMIMIGRGMEYFSLFNLFSGRLMRDAGISRGRHDGCCFLAWRLLAYSRIGRSSVQEVGGAKKDPKDPKDPEKNDAGDQFKDVAK